MKENSIFYNNEYIKCLINDLRVLVHISNLKFCPYEWTNTNRKKCIIYNSITDSLECKQNREKYNIEINNNGKILYYNEDKYDIETITDIDYNDYPNTYFMHYLNINNDNIIFSVGLILNNYNEIAELKLKSSKEHAKNELEKLNKIWTNTYKSPLEIK